MGYLMLGPGPLDRPPGILVFEIPVQTPLDPHERSGIEYKGHFLIYKAHFHIKARVLSKKRYRFFGYSDLSPWDLALGWRRMSDSDVLQHYKISQGGRFYTWRYEGQPYIPSNEVIVSSANMHMIPRDPKVMDVLDDVREGDVIEIKGFLVDIRKDQQVIMRTSMTRNDGGAGACEIIYVEEAKIIYN